MKSATKPRRKLLALLVAGSAYVIGFASILLAFLADGALGSLTLPVCLLGIPIAGWGTLFAFFRHKCSERELAVGSVVYLGFILLGMWSFGYMLGAAGF